MANQTVGTKSFWKKFHVWRVTAPGGLLLLTASLSLAQLQTPNVQASDPVDAVAIVVTPFGPYPASVEHPAGPFILFVINRSGVLEETFSLVKPASVAGTGMPGDQTSAATPGDQSSAPTPSLLDLHSTASLQRDHQLINPLPGSYQLRFAAHPDWVVAITIGK